MKKSLLLLGGSCLLAHAAAHGQALTGTVTVGGSAPTYPTLTAAVADLQTRGVGAGGLTVALRPGTYAERIALTTLVGSSVANPVRFVGRGGPVTLQPVGTSAADEAAVSVTACDYITFDSLNVADGGTSAANRLEVGYYLTGTASKGSTRITVSNCAVRLGGGAAPVGTGTRGVWVVSAATSVANTNDFNRVLNVRVDKVAVGIQLAGRANFSGLPTFPDRGNEVRGCMLGGQRFIGLDGASGSALGIAVGSQRRLSLLDNRIDSVLVRNASPLLPVNASAISLDNASGRISGNRIGYVRYAGTGGSLASGIRASIILGDTLRVFNNFIGGISRVDYVPGASDNSMYVLGIWLFKQAGGGGFSQIYHNTVVLPAAAQPLSYTAACFYLNGGSGGNFPAELRNNILVNRLSTIAGQFAFAVVDGNSARTNLVSNNNLLLASGTNGAIGQTNRELGGTRVTSLTLADWQTNSGYDPASVSQPVAFANEAAGSLYLAGASLSPAFTGPYLAAVPLDIDGRPRNPSTPYLGAAEGALMSATARPASQLNDLQLFPNPARDAVTVAFRQAAAGAVRLTVLDGLGRTVYAFSPGTGLAAGPAQVRLPLPALAPGLYFVRVDAPGADGRPATGVLWLNVL